jgi:hypothetical protein
MPVMAGKAKLVLALAIAALLAMAIGACGGGDDSPAATGTSPAGATREGGTADGDGFRVPGGDNSIQNFGREANASEREAASAALEAYMRARAARDEAKACVELAKVAVEPLEKLAAASPKLGGNGCAAILASLDERSTAAKTMTEPVGSLRVEGDRAFALYHGAGDLDYVIQMTREGGAWKVAALAPIELP